MKKELPDFDFLSNFDIDLSLNKRKIGISLIKNSKIESDHYITLLSQLPEKKRLGWITVLDDYIGLYPSWIETNTTLFLDFCAAQAHETAKRCVSKSCLFLLKNNYDFFSSKHKEKLIEIHFSWLMDDSLVATKANCISVLYLLRKENNWILEELIAAIEQQIPKSSLAFKSRGIKILKEIQKEKTFKKQVCLQK